MGRGLADMRAPGADGTSQYYLVLMATVLCRLRQFDESLRMIDESISIIERTGERYYQAMVYQTKGELFLAHVPPSLVQAEECFRIAIAIAHKQQAKSSELRATTSFARLLAKQDRREEARTMLAEIYGWFTEDFDTADLNDAKALLDKLAT
jgi:predicted ATPase